MQTAQSFKRTKNMGEMELLEMRKKALKEEILNQQERLEDVTHQLLSPIQLTSSLFRTFTKGLNIIDALTIGFKTARIIRRMFVKNKM
jgi:hypothetical protein